MTTGNGDSGKPGKAKSFRVPDHELWLKLARSVTPLERARSNTLAGTEHISNKDETKSADAPPLPKSKISAPAPPRLPRSAQQPAPPALSKFDRRTRQKLTRGNVNIEARLDLHGHSAARAHGALLEFVSASRAQGIRTVLVITGKGSSPYARHTLHGADHFHNPERQGRLRRLVPEWLNEAMFRIHVSGFQPAHPRHGGGGAFYVRLRRYS